jgi:hypothetical protein
VFYLATNEHVYQLYYAYATQTWVDQDLTSQTGAEAASSGSALTSFADSQEHVFYQGADQHVYQLVTHPGGWVEQDLTATTGGAVAIANTPLTSYGLAGAQSVFYLNTCQVINAIDVCPIYDFYYNGSVWSNNNIFSGALPGSMLVSSSFGALPPCCVQVVAQLGLSERSGGLEAVVVASGAFETTFSSFIGTYPFPQSFYTFIDP